MEEGNQAPVSLENRWYTANHVYSLREQTVQPVEGECLALGGSKAACRHR